MSNAAPAGGGGLGGSAGIIISAVAGTAIAALAAVGIVTAFNQAPAPVDQPYVIYGSGSTTPTSAPG